MYDLDKLIDFLESIEEFYKAKEGEEKQGIGHEIEHINGVILRAAEYAQFVNEDLKTYKQKDLVDLGIVATCAALHDIGNVIERDAHGQYAFGVVMGKLEFDDFFKVPYKNKETKRYLTDTEIEDLKNTIKQHGYFFKEMDNDNFPVVTSFLTAQVFFDLAYNDNKIESEIELREYLKKYPNLSKDIEDYIVKNLMDKEGHMLISYNPKLREITEQIQEIFGSSSKELDIIAKAVQDHNIDYKNDMERYTSRSIYGMIVSDADKDTVPEVFAIRTIAYAANKLGVQKHKKYCLEEHPTEDDIQKWGTTFVPNLRKCATHVLHQAWERFRESNDDYQLRTGKPISKRDFWRDIAEYKEKLSGTKGIADVKSIKCPESQYDKEQAVAGRNYVVDSEHNLITFMILPQEGEDLHSELDNFSRTTKIRDSRKPFIDKVREWSDPAKEKECINQVVKLAKEWGKAKSNEEIISKYEANARKGMFKSPKEYSFKRIIEKVLKDGYVGGYRNTDSLDAILATAKAERSEKTEGKARSKNNDNLTL